MRNKRKMKPVVLQLLMIVVSIISIFLIIGVGSEILTMLELQKQNKLVEKELQHLEQENASLTNQKTKLQDDNYVQTYARGNYMFTKDGEQIFHLPKNDNLNTDEN